MRYPKPSLHHRSDEHLWHLHFLLVDFVFLFPGLVRYNPFCKASKPEKFVQALHFFLPPHDEVIPTKRSFYECFLPEIVELCYDSHFQLQIYCIACYVKVNTKLYSQNNMITIPLISVSFYSY